MTTNESYKKSADWTEEDEKFTTREIDPESEAILDAMYRKRKIDWVLRTEVKEYCRANVKRSDGQRYQYGLAKIVKNRFLKRKSPTRPGQAEILVNLALLPDTPFAHVRDDARRRPSKGKPGPRHSSGERTLNRSSRLARK